MGYFTEPKKPRVKAQLNVRFLVLVMSSWLMIGSYYCYDNPSALQKQMRARQFKHMAIADFDLYFNLLYTVYSIPNIILPFLGGYMVDWLGARWMNVLFSSLITTGQLIFAFGDHIRSFPVMLAGRVVFGFGGESLSVGCSTIVADWFMGRELAFALGMQISIARIGSVLNDISSPRLVSLFDSVPLTLYFGVLICASSTICALCIVPVDKKAEKRLDDAGANIRKEGDPEEEQISFKEVKDFQASFWLLTFSCVVVYGCVLPFNNIAQNLIIDKFICHGACCPNAAANAPQCAKLTTALSQTSLVMGIPYTISAILSPFMGGLIDRIGGRAIFALVSSSALIGVHTSIALLSNGIGDLYAPLVFQGLAYSVFAAALWPSVPYVVKKHQVGTAYGIMTAIQNGGLALFPVIVATIHGKTGKYEDVEFFFVFLAGLGLICAIVLNILDYKRGSVLNKPHLTVNNDNAEEKVGLLDSLAVVTPELTPGDHTINVSSA